MTRRRDLAARLAVRSALCVLLGSGWAAAQDAFGALRFTHQSPDAPLVDVLIDGRAALRDVPFGAVSRYLLLPAGRHEVVIFPHRLPDGVAPADDAASEAPGDGESALPTVPELDPVVTFVTVEEGAYYTAVLTGFYEPPAEEGQLGHLSIALSPDEAQFTLSGPRGYAAEFTDDQLITGLQPGTYTIVATAEGYAQTTYEVQIGPRETTTLSIALQEEEGEATEATSPVVEDDRSDATEALELQTFEDAFGGVPEASAASIRVVHASPTSPSLIVVASPTSAEDDDGAGDVEGDGGEGDGGAAVEIGSVGYPGASAYVGIPAGSYTLSYLVEANGQPLIELEGLELLPGEIYTFILTSDTAGSRPRIVPVVDAMVVREGDPR